MNGIEFSDAAALGVDWPEDRTPMPDSGIRAISDIIRQGAESTQQMIATLASASLGLSNVIGGSNPGVAMPPQKISGLNGQELAAIGNLATNLGEKSEGSDSDTDTKTPATTEVPPIPQGQDEAPPTAPAPKTEETSPPATPVDTSSSPPPTTDTTTVTDAGKDVKNPASPWYDGTPPPSATPDDDNADAIAATVPDIDIGDFGF